MRTHEKGSGRDSYVKKMLARSTTEHDGPTARVDEPRHTQNIQAFVKMKQKAVAARAKNRRQRSQDSRNDLRTTRAGAKPQPMGGQDRTVGPLFHIEKMRWFWALQVLA